MKKGSRKFFALALAVLMMLMLAACGGGASSSTAAPASTADGDASTADASTATDAGGKIGEGLRIGLITPIGGLGDKSIGDECYNGVKNGADLLGYEFDYSEPMTAPDLEALVVEYSESGDYDLIFLSAYDAYEFLQTCYSDYPDQNYIVYDIAGDDNPQINTQWFSKNQIGFMAGVFQALMEPLGEVTVNGETKTWEPSNKIGIIIGSEVPSTVGSVAGAAAGAKYINPDIEYLYAQIGSWKDQARGKELALSQYDEGVNIIYHNAGAGSLGILEAAKERDRFFVGYDANQNELDATHVLASSVKMNQDVILRVLTEFCEGTLPYGEAVENGYNNGGIDFIYQDGLEVPDEVMAVMEDVKEKLKSGEIKAPTTWEEVEAFTDVYEG